MKNESLCYVLFRYLTGMTGLEIFDDQGDLIWRDRGIKSVSATPAGEVAADPSHSSLSHSSSTAHLAADDPRRVTNLVDGSNLTRDDLHAWLSPITTQSKTNFPTYPHPPLIIVTIIFEGVRAISLLRVFNYNKSRAHTGRGVKSCAIDLDGSVIYAGYN
jgi:hypothetical protein